MFEKKKIKNRNLFDNATNLKKKMQILTTLPSQQKLTQVSARKYSRRVRAKENDNRKNQFPFGVNYA